MNKTLTDYNNKHSKFYKATKSEGMKTAIDFASTQRRNTEMSIQSDNGSLPSQGQGQKTKEFFKN